MEIQNWEEYLLNEKKRRFLDAVDRAAKSLNFVSPKVNFWKDACPYSTGKEWAHIHLEIGVICVSEFRLEQMTYDIIEEVATHEVTHLVNATHDSNFHQTHVEVKVSSWTAPSGVISIDGGKKSNERTKKRTKNREIKTRCNYHLCKKKTTLEQCRYCNGYFCSEHINPREPYMMNFESQNIDDIEKRTAQGGHPCPPYVDVIKDKKIQNNEKYGVVLDALRNSPSPRFRETPYLDFELSSYRPDNKKGNLWWLIIFFLIILFILIFLLK